MNKKSKIILAVSLAIIAFMIGKAFILDESSKIYLVIFAFVGLGLAMLRLFINGMIKKMKGKPVGVKVMFFAVLLGCGIPFQNWFRTDILLAMDREYLVPCIVVTVASVFFMTVLSGVISQRKRASQIEEMTIEQ
ncbi:MFS transporter permease [Solibacillus sp. FSL W7-1436]|uniref:MFS transporter permease n=1 Tax=Solibacillus sp. FSL W7-1436 TaxID=2921705 RepID=UPI0030F6F0E5